MSDKVLLITEFVEQILFEAYLRQVKCGSFWHLEFQYHGIIVYHRIHFRFALNSDEIPSNLCEFVCV